MPVYTATPQSPADGASSPVARPTVQALFDTDDGSSGDLQFEFDDNTAFSNANGRYQVVTTLGHADGALGSAQPPTDLPSRVPHFWRVRAGLQSGPTWGDWSTPRRLTYAANAGNAAMGTWQNAGVYVQHTGKTAIGVWHNVGFYVVHSRKTGMGVWQNVGFYVVHTGKTAIGSWQEGRGNIVPTPHIWYLIPDSGRPGDGFRIIGMGFGSSAVQYNGKAYLGVPLDLDHQLPVVDWDEVAATVDAYGPARVISPDLINVEYEYIDVTVYDDAESAAVRVVTDA